MEVMRQIKGLERRFETQTKHSSTHQMDTVADLQNKLHNHIQMMIGKQRDITNRLQVL